MAEEATSPRAHRAAEAWEPALVRAVFVASAVALVLGAGPSVAARDGGELAAAAATLGVAHPTGFSLEVLLLRAAMIVPVGDLAFRANALTAALGALCAAMVARASLSLTRPAQESLAPLARAALAVASAVALLASSTILRAFTQVEVYASALALSLFALRSVDQPRPGYAPAPALLALLALSFSTHTTVRSGVLAALVAWLAHDARALVRSARPSLRTAAWWALPALSCALVVLYLPIAARREPWADWGAPTDARGVLAHVSAARIREAFRSQMGLSEGALRAAHEAGSIVLSDLGPALVLLALAGLVYALGFTRRTVTTALALALAGDALYAVLVNPMGARDRQTLMLAEACLVLFASVGVVAIAQAIHSNNANTAKRTAAWTTVAAGLVALALSRVDLAQTGAVEGWTAVEVYGGPGAIGALPPRAVVLCESDELCGGSLYARAVEGERPDAVVLPRQHLWERSTWRRLRVALGHAPRERYAPRSADEALRQRRLRAVLSVFGPRVRWEQGERVDERIAGVSLFASESPTLAVAVVRGARDTTTTTPTVVPFATDTLESVSRWLRPRESRGVLARRISATVLFSAGMRAAASSQLSDGVPLWNACVERDPSHAGALTNLGVARAAQGDLAGAIALTERALASDPRRSVAWENLLRYVTATRDPSRAAQVRERARSAGVNLAEGPRVDAPAP